MTGPSTYSGIMPGQVNPIRTAGTATEDCWNIILVKPISKQLDVIRFGAGSDRYMHYEQKIVAYDPVTCRYFLVDIDEFKKSIDRLNHILLGDDRLYLDDLLNSLPNLNP